MVTFETNVITARWHAANAIGLNPWNPGPSAINVAVTDTFTNTGREFLKVDNDVSNTKLTVTVDCDIACDHGFTHDIVFDVPAGESRLVGPFPTAWFGSAVDLTYSFASTHPNPAGITVFQLPARSDIPE